MRSALSRPVRLLGAGLLLAIACPGAAEAAQQQYALTGFTKLHVDGPYHVVVATGRGTSARGEGDRDALDAVEMRSNGSTLTIRRHTTGNAEADARGIGSVTLYLTTGDLGEVQITGSGDVDVDRLEGLDLQLGIAGAGSLAVESIAADKLTVTMAGSGSATLTGTAKTGAIRMIGAGVLNADTLVVDQLTIGSEGAGSVHVTARDTAKLAVQGPGEVIVKGSPVCTVGNIGTGEVRCGE